MGLRRTAIESTALYTTAESSNISGLLGAGVLKNLYFFSPAPGKITPEKLAISPERKLFKSSEIESMRDAGVFDVKADARSEFPGI